MRISIGLVLNLIIGLIFILSSILKLCSIEDFELYLFSFGIFRFSFYSFIARLIIGLELCLGVGYIINIYHKFFYYTIFAITICFTIILGYLLITGSNENCHCFGEAVNITPLESIIKNMLLLILLKLSKKKTDPIIDLPNRYLFITAMSLLFIAPFFVNPPTSIKALTSPVKTINVQTFNKFIRSNPEIDWGRKTKAIFFFSTACNHCKMTARKASQIMENNNLPKENIMFLFWKVNNNSVKEFLFNTGSEAIRYDFMDIVELLTITEGRVPAIVFYDNSGNPAVYNINTLDESKLIMLLKN
ncbi:MAG: hypothetical protein M0R37_00080 [Bacteroidales bacterium]|nr:hypothetical protein [Bacteroidales bacterium]